MNNVFHVIQKSYKTNFCLAINNTAIAESFGDEYNIRLNQRWLTSDSVKALQRKQYLFYCVIVLGLVPTIHRDN